MIASTLCTMRHAVSHSAPRRSQGAVLIMVLVIIGMLSLGAYSFSEAMLSEYRALRAGTDELRTRAASDSGISSVLLSLDASRSKRRVGSGSGNFADMTWNDSIGDEYSVTIFSGAKGTRWEDRRGPLDESAKLNVNGLKLEEEHELESRQRLLAIPGMTVQAADSLLDWIDADEIEREFGAESNWYLSQGLPYTPRQGALRSLQELLLVRGFEMARLFGEDTNANGWLDLQEDDGDSSIPSDNGDHRLDAGWSQWLTVHAAESNLDDRGKPKVYVNQDDLANLFRELESQLGTEAARFIVAIRMNGPMDSDGAGKFDSFEETEKRKATAKARARQQTTESINFTEFRSESINGFTINGSGRFTINSVVDLIGRRTEAVVDDRDVILTSPWGDNAQRIEAALNLLEDRLSVVPGMRNVSRINIELADREVLMTIPYLTSDVASTIMKTRSGRSFAASRVGAPRSIGWLYQSGIVDLQTLRRIAPYITTGGDVFSGVSLGSVLGAKQATAAMFRVDATGLRPSLSYQEYHATQSPNAVGRIQP